MCLIIHKPAGKAFNPALFGIIKFHNPHGFGIMHPNGNGEIKARKGLLSMLQILELWDEHYDKNLAMHFRYATEGAVTPENCHPYRVLNKAEHGRDLFMMHNGTLRAIPIKTKGRSDTFHFVSNYLAPLLREHPDFINSKKFQEFVGGMIGTSRLLFMDGDGETIIINKELGSMQGDVWVSNQYSLKYPKPDTRRGAKKKTETTTTTSSTTTATSSTTSVPAVIPPPAPANVVPMDDPSREVEHASATRSSLMATTHLHGSQLDGILPRSSRTQEPTQLVLGTDPSGGMD